MFESERKKLFSAELNAWADRCDIVSKSAEESLESLQSDEYLALMRVYRRNRAIFQVLSDLFHRMYEE